jgi:hypothetical protein
MDKREIISAWVFYPHLSLFCAPWRKFYHGLLSFCLPCPLRRCQFIETVRRYLWCRIEKKKREGRGIGVRLRKETGLSLYVWEKKSRKEIWEASLWPMSLLLGLRNLSRQTELFWKDHLWVAILDDNTALRRDSLSDGFVSDTCVTFLACWRDTLGTMMGAESSQFANATHCLSHSRLVFPEQEDNHISLLATWGLEFYFFPTAHPPPHLIGGFLRIGTLHSSLGQWLLV